MDRDGDEVSMGAIESGNRTSGRTFYLQSPILGGQIQRVCNCVDINFAVVRIAAVRGDWFGFIPISEQGTPVKFRDGPAAVCHRRSTTVDLIVYFFYSAIVFGLRCDVNRE